MFRVVSTSVVHIREDLPPHLELSEFPSERVPRKALYHIKCIDVVLFYYLMSIFTKNNLTKTSESLYTT